MECIANLAKVTKVTNQIIKKSPRNPRGLTRTPWSGWLWGASSLLLGICSHFDNGDSWGLKWWWCRWWWYGREEDVENMDDDEDHYIVWWGNPGCFCALMMMMLIMIAMMIWMMGRPLHCLIKPTQVAVVLRRLHVALAKAGPRLRRYEMWW